MKRFLVCLAALALAPACGLAEDDVAATVNTHEISSASLERFASTPFIKSQAQTSGGLTSNLPGSVGGSTLRVALPFQIQTLVFEDAVKDLKGEITPADLDSAEQTLAQNESDPQTGQQRPIDARARKVLKRYVAAQAALARLLSEGDSATAVTPADIASFFEANKAQYGNLSCVEGFAVTEAAGAQAQAALDAGSTVAEVLANPELQAQGLSQSGAPECVYPAVVTNESIAPIVFEGRVGVWQSVTVDDGSGTGSMVVVFLRPTSRTEATATTPEIASAIGEMLQQQAQQADTEKVTGRFQKLFEDADVTVDPRLGTWNPKDQTQLILPPPVPVAPLVALPGIPAPAPA